MAVCYQTDVDDVTMLHQYDTCLTNHCRGSSTFLLALLFVESVVFYNLPQITHLLQMQGGQREIYLVVLVASFVLIRQYQHCLLYVSSFSPPLLLSLLRFDAARWDRFVNVLSSDTTRPLMFLLLIKIILSDKIRCLEYIICYFE